MLPPAIFDVTRKLLTTLLLKLKLTAFNELALVMLPKALIVPPVMPGPTLMSVAMTLPAVETFPPVLILLPVMLPLVEIILAIILPVIFALPPVILPLPDTVPVLNATLPTNAEPLTLPPVLI